ncbi:hypothetical protein HDV06_001421 [Boothiomyces sp. JEL0866]|nr:hypothetical protein HDV06_001421 [Boothiomyces sp. JEL0866]
MKFATPLLFTAAYAHIHLLSPIARGLQTAGTEDEIGESTGPCGANNGKALTTPGPRTNEPLQFTLKLEQADDNASVNVFAAVGQNPTTFSTKLFSKSGLSASNMDIPIDLSKLPGLSGNTPVTIQIAQTGSDTGDSVKYICADIMVSAPSSSQPSSAPSTSNTNTGSSGGMSSPAVTTNPSSGSTPVANSPVTTGSTSVLSSSSSHSLFGLVAVILAL